MRLVAWLPRADHLRMLGPVLDAARRRGWHVFALCPMGGPKDDAHRQREALSAQLGGLPVAPIRRGAGEALEALEHVDAVVAVGLIQQDWVRDWVMPASRSRGTAWVSLGYLQEELLQVLIHGPALLHEWDVATTSTPEGVEWVAEELARTRSAAVAREARRLFVPVGAPSLDPLLGLDRAACRAKHGLPKDGRVLLFVPAAHPHLMARWRWWVFDGPLSWLAAPLILPTYTRIGRAVRAYAERHEASIVVKTRAKNPDPPWLSELGHVVTDLSWHPHTTLELVVAADAYCGLVSGTALEATAAGLPQTHFFAWPPEASEHPLFLPLRQRFWLHCGPWNYPALAEAVHLHQGPWLAEAWVGNSRWPRRPAPEDCQAALRAITGPIDGNAADRVLDAVDAAR